MATSVRKCGMWRAEKPHGEIGYHAIRTGDNPGEHTEVVLYGETQKTKSSETAAQAHTYLFVEGLLPCIFVRLRGGKEVGSVDMKGAVEDYNADFKKAIGDILPHYGFSPDLDRKEWAKRRDELAVRCTSPYSHVPPLPQPSTLTILPCHQVVPHPQAHKQAADPLLQHTWGARWRQPGPAGVPIRHTSPSS